MCPQADVPPNLIVPGCTLITPEMVPLVALTSSEIRTIVNAIPGGSANVQDIYPLAPVQEGILFHHLMAKQGDPYLRLSLTAFDTRARLRKFLRALQGVVDRHDILRTAILWEGLSKPVQVVCRHTTVPVEMTVTERSTRDPGGAMQQRFNPRIINLDVRQAPWMRLKIARDRRQQRWLLLMLLHHLAYDGVTLEIMKTEINDALLDFEGRLRTPIPFRNFVATSRLSMSNPEHEAFFRRFLRGVAEPTVPFGLAETLGDGTSVYEVQQELEPELAEQLRRTAARLNVSAAKICHLAWAKVLSRVSGTKDVIFGTMLSARGRELLSHDGTQSMMGPAMNLLPMRINLTNDSVMTTVRRVAMSLSDLRLHKHASGALAQHCSAMDSRKPLFSSLLNYRRRPGLATLSSEAAENARLIEGIYGGVSNYPLALAIDEIGDRFVLTAQVSDATQPAQVCVMMRTTLSNLLKALEVTPDMPIGNIDVLPRAERRRILTDWNKTEAEFQKNECLHSLFEEQVQRTPDTIAIVNESGRLTYRELNNRANQLAHYLRRLGVRPDSLVAIYVDRSPSMMIGLLAILKAGGAYVPLDPIYPRERLAYMLKDTSPVALLVQDDRLDDIVQSISAKVRVLTLENRNQPW